MAHSSFLAGPSGSGKTTLLRIIAGLESATSGRVFFDGEDYTNIPVQDRNVGFMFQSYALFKRMTVADNVGYGLRTAKRRGKLSPVRFLSRGLRGCQNVANPKDMLP